MTSSKYSETTTQNTTQNKRTLQDYEKAYVRHYNYIFEKSITSFDEIPERLRNAYKLGHMGTYISLLTPIVIQMYNKGSSFRTIALNLKICKTKAHFIIKKNLNVL